MIVKRKCIVTGKIVPTNNLIRFVLLKNGDILFEKDKKILGRGAYCINDNETIEVLFKRKILNKSFKKNISHEKYEILKKEVEEYVIKK